MESFEHIGVAEHEQGDTLVVRERRLDAAQKRIVELVGTIDSEVGASPESAERLKVLRVALAGRLRAMGADNPDNQLSKGDNIEAGMISILLAYYDSRIAGMEKTLESEHIREQIKRHFPIIDRSMIVATRHGA